MYGGQPAMRSGSWRAVAGLLLVVFPSVCLALTNHNQHVKREDWSATSEAVKKLREGYSSGEALSSELEALELEHPVAALQATIQTRALSDTLSQYERWRWAKLGEADSRVLEAATALRSGPSRPPAQPRPDWWKPVAGAVAELGYWTLRGSAFAEGVLLDELSAREADDWVARDIDATLRKAWATPERVDVLHAVDSARALLVAGDAQAALAKYQHVTSSLAPEWPEAWRQQGRLLHVALDRAADAKRAYEVARNLNPRNYVVLLDYGRLLNTISSSSGELCDQARAAFVEAGDLNPALRPMIQSALDGTQ